MHFKQLEIVGFKSFPHKTKLRFEPGVTAVVGPNGCGKSNISDAIRWVLGEQSPRSLRGSSMDEVIFNGTDATEPVNMAEVSLTLANEDRLLPIDYNEVTITRRLFRSGESEYILNKTPVRLKDINNLLMGTGMGTSSYSIIEQGKIDLILSSKPEERRYIFEEASGITKFKSQKKEALRKLEHTENNLIRINDIIQEVKRQINSIERHAKKAERYKVDFEVLKDLDLKLATHQMRGLSGKIEKNQSALNDLRAEENELKREIELLTGSLDKARKDLELIMGELTDTQKKLADATLFIDKGKHKEALNKERIRDLEQMKKEAEEETTRLKERIDRQKEETERLASDVNEMINRKEEKESMLRERHDLKSSLALEISEHEKEEKAAKDRTVDLLASQTRTKNELIKIGVDLHNRRARVRRLEMEKENVDSERKQVEDEHEKLKMELSGCEAKLSSRKELLNERRERLREIESETEKTARRIAEDENAFNLLSSKEDVLKEMIKNYEGFDKGVKTIMESAKSSALSGVIGVVAEMIEPDAGHEMALEVALREKAQAVVVESEEVLEEAISLVSSTGGEAHFIVFDDIKNGYLEGCKHLNAEAEGVQALGSLVKAEAVYERVKEYLLNDIYVARSREHAYGLNKKFGDKATFVTKDGFLVENGYLFGRFAKSDIGTSLIGRKRRLEEIALEKERIAAEIDALRSGLSDKKGKMNHLKAEIASNEEIERTEEIERANIVSRKETVLGTLKKLSDETSLVCLELSEMEDLIKEITQRGTDLNNKLNEDENEYTKLQEFISGTREAIQRKTKRDNELTFEMADSTREVSYLDASKADMEKRLEKERRTLEEFNGQLSGKEETIRDSEDKMRVLETETDSLEGEIEAKKTEEAYHSEKLEAVSKEKQDMLKDIHAKESCLKEKDGALNEIKNRIHEIDISTREGELRAVNIKDRIREAYKLDIMAENIEVPEGMNWEEAKNQIEVLRIKLEKLGPVNLVAIEEHKELEERYAFLTQQEEDLQRAKESLHKAILKINKTTKQLFIEAFQKIQVEFRDYFRMLFGGGHAELLLLDESDILESGIEIVARPPGKKLQNLLLLSGGEKALTAISLLFAIFKVRPSPFCILDEVDAPLDDSNIGRFTRILQDFLKTSQFIVITHNKKTMQMANILYGITMEQKGISKIVSVRFADEDGRPKEEAVGV